MYFMLILVSGAKMQLPLQLGVTDRQTDRQTDSVTDSTTTVTLCACALRVNYIIIELLCNSGFSGVVKSGAIVTTPRPGLVNAVTEISDTTVPGFRDGMMMKVVASTVVFIIRLPPLTL